MPTPLRALIVEDSKFDAELIIRQLTNGSFDLKWEIVEDWATMWRALEERTWDVIISDYSMPCFNGRAALALCKEMGLDIPFICVSGTIGEEVAVEMMKAGAHDYVMKGNLTRLGPAIERELLAAQQRLKRRHAEAQATHLAAIVESSDDAIISTSLKGTILSWNRGAARVFGHAPDKVIGCSINELAPPSRFKEFPELFTRLDRGEQIDRFETVLAHKDGRPIEVSVTISAITDADGNIVGAATIARDITERRRREQERLQLIEELTIALTRVKTLSGMLPICAWCKKIRDDHGYWKQIEVYLKEHSHADFTHGICPDCREGMRPKVVDTVITQGNRNFSLQ